MNRDDFRSFGRRRGRKLRPYQLNIVSSWLPALEIVSEAYESSVLDPSTLFKDSAAPLHLEIGFGNGEYLLHRAQCHPEINHIGAEPFENGVAKLVTQIAASHRDNATGFDNPIDNIRIFTDDVRILIDRLPNACLERVDILFPDPWPKARHHRRRLIQQRLVQRLRRVMKSHATLHIATDHAQYLTSILALMQQNPDFRWQASVAQDWRVPYFGFHTRYAHKARANGRQSYYLHYCLDDSFACA